MVKSLPLMLQTDVASHESAGSWNAALGIPEAELENAGEGRIGTWTWLTGMRGSISVTNAIY